jgi:hypothetical protein
MEDGPIGRGELRLAGLLKALVYLGAFVLRLTLARDLGDFLRSAGWAAHAVGPT